MVNSLQNDREPGVDALQTQIYPSAAGMISTP